jgi:hypothetical protein
MRKYVHGRPVFHRRGTGPAQPAATAAGKATGARAQLISFSAYAAIQRLRALCRSIAGKTSRCNTLQTGARKVY